MPYHRELKDGNKILVSKMLLISKADALWVADEMNKTCKEFTYRAAPRFLGYEGADYGVNYYHKFDFQNESSNKYAGHITSDAMLELCKDRPIVHQSKSWE